MVWICRIVPLVAAGTDAHRIWFQVSYRGLTKPEGTGHNDTSLDKGERAALPKEMSAIHPFSLPSGQYGTFSFLSCTTGYTGMKGTISTRSRPRFSQTVAPALPMRPQVPTET